MVPERAPTKKATKEPQVAPKPTDTRAADAKARAERAQQARAMRAHGKALATAERELQRSRKAAEQATFKVRKLAGELQRAQAEEEKRAGQVSIAEQKVAGLRHS
jgi:hypothetical protein